MRVTWLDREAVLARLTEAVRTLAERRPEVDRVFLFGSLATAQAVPGSDADLIVVLTSSDLAFQDRIPLYTPDGAGIGVDVFPYTFEEIRHMTAQGNALLRDALREPLELFSRVCAKAGSEDHSPAG